MPYIKQEDRDKLQERLDGYKNFNVPFRYKVQCFIDDECKKANPYKHQSLDRKKNHNYQFKPGQSNYIIYSLMVNEMNTQGKSYTNCYEIYFALKQIEKDLISEYRKSWHETFITSFLTTLDLARAEFYRRHLAPYEDDKIEENGDVE